MTTTRTTISSRASILSCEGISYDDKIVSAWFSTALKRPCQLVRVIADQEHAEPPVGHHCTVKHSIENETKRQNENTRTGFANRAPYLLLSRGSVHAMQAKMDRKAPVSEDIFRANFIVDGCLPHEEDQWVEIAIGRHWFDVLGPCSRCTMVNIDPHTGAIENRTLQTLARYRRERAKIFFGQYLNRRLLSTDNIDDNRDSWVRLNDVIHVIKRTKVNPRP
jgi:molybdenum cofactor sulfurtransferase